MSNNFMQFNHQGVKSALDPYWFLSSILQSALQAFHSSWASLWEFWFQKDLRISNLAWRTEPLVLKGRSPYFHLRYRLEMAGLVEVEIWIGDIGCDKSPLNGPTETWSQFSIMPAAASTVMPLVGAPKWSPRDAAQHRNRWRAIDGPPFLSEDKRCLEYMQGYERTDGKLLTRHESLVQNPWVAASIEEFCKRFSLWRCLQSSLTCSIFYNLNWAKTLNT